MAVPIRDAPRKKAAYFTLLGSIVLAFTHSAARATNSGRGIFVVFITPAQLLQRCPKTSWE
jgi:hypothetical protein